MSAIVSTTVGRSSFLNVPPILLKQKDLIVFGKQLILSKKQLGLLSPTKGEQTDAN